MISSNSLSSPFTSDDEIARLKRGHGNTMLKVEGSIKDSQQELCRKDAEIKELKASLLHKLYFACLL